MTWLLPTPMSTSTPRRISHGRGLVAGVSIAYDTDRDAVEQPRPSDPRWPPTADATGRCRSMRGIASTVGRRTCALRHPDTLTTDHVDSREQIGQRLAAIHTCHALLTYRQGAEIRHWLATATARGQMASDSTIRAARASDSPDGTVDTAGGQSSRSPIDAGWQSCRRASCPIRFAAVHGGLATSKVRTAGTSDHT